MLILMFMNRVLNNFKLTRDFVDKIYIIRILFIKIL